MTVQELGDKLQVIAHDGKSLSRAYVLIGDKLKEVTEVKTLENGNGYIVTLEVEE